MPVDVKALLEAGSHFGHRTSRWNPKMKPYIFGIRGGVHVIDLAKTVPALEEALEFVVKTTSSGGQILFVGTKRQSKAIIGASARAAGMPYVTERWLGGMLTNFRTIASRVARLLELDEGLSSGELSTKYNKKEVLDFTNERDDLDRIYGGIRGMAKQPAAVFVVDINRDHIAIAEAESLGIPVVAIADTNTNPEFVTYPIPANDDAIRSIKLIADLVAEAAADGAKTYQKQLQKSEAEVK